MEGHFSVGDINRFCARIGCGSLQFSEAVHGKGPVKRAAFILSMPVAGILLLVLLVQSLNVNSNLKAGMSIGLGAALGQTLVSVGAMLWAWKKSFFYWVWGAGILFRMIVFAGTAFWVVRKTDFHLVSVLGPLVVVTTIFLVVESTLMGRN